MGGTVVLISVAIILGTFAAAAASAKGPLESFVSASNGVDPLGHSPAYAPVGGTMTSTGGSAPVQTRASGPEAGPSAVRGADDGGPGSSSPPPSSSSPSSSSSSPSSSPSGPSAHSPAPPSPPDASPPTVAPPDAPPLTAPNAPDLAPPPAPDGPAATSFQPDSVLPPLPPVDLASPARDATSAALAANGTRLDPGDAAVAPRADGGAVPATIPPEGAPDPRQPSQRAGLDASAPPITRGPRTPGVILDPLDPPAVPRVVVESAVLALAIYLWLRAGPWSSLYSRFTRSDLLTHPTRRQVYETIRARPGQHVAALTHAVGVGRVVLQHHLRLLESHHVIVSQRHGRRRAYFAAGSAPPATTVAAHLALDAPARHRVLEALSSAMEGRTQLQVARATGVSPRMVSYHLAQLEAIGLVRAHGVKPRLYVAARPETIRIRAEPVGTHET